MTKKELLNRLSQEAQIPKTKADMLLVALSTVITEALVAGDEVTLPGIGKLQVEQHAARKGRNPRTGEAIDIPAKQVPHFSAAKDLREAVKKLPLNPSAPVATTPATAEIAGSDNTEATEAATTEVDIETQAG